jgi:predicted transcriptional regulator
MAIIFVDKIAYAAFDIPHTKIPLSNGSVLEANISVDIKPEEPKELPRELLGSKDKEEESESRIPIARKIVKLPSRQPSAEVVTESMVVSHYSSDNEEPKTLTQFKEENRKLRSIVAQLEKSNLELKADLGLILNKLVSEHKAQIVTMLKSELNICK